MTGGGRHRHRAVLAAVVAVAGPSPPRPDTPPPPLHVRSRAPSSTVKRCSKLLKDINIYLYDGSPTYPNKKSLIRFCYKEKINFFGVSAKYIDFLKKENFKFNKLKFPELKVIASTGSPLVKECFEYVYKNIKKDVHLTSISGGTDVVGCLVLGNIFSKVYAGEIQGESLGIDVDIFNEKGKKVLKNQKGELVIKKPFPTMPIKFWNDLKNKKLRKAYFSRYKNIWHHGDFIQKTKNGGFIIYGRSDATLNPGGVRIGTAEIYRQVEKINFIRESLVVGQEKDGDVKAVSHYTKQLGHLDKRGETDTGVLYETKDGMIGFKHTSNKASLTDPHSNKSIGSKAKSMNESADRQKERGRFSEEQVEKSRKAVQEDLNSEEREKIFATIQEGSLISGTVKNLTDYGAFVDLGGVDGLLHITDITWKRINHPSEILNVGDKLDFKVTNFDKEKLRISLGLKQLTSDPWENIKETFPINSIHKAKVSSIAEYGFFAELDSNTEGLVHISEIDWTNKSIHPSKVVSLGDEVDVMILEIDIDKRRVSLGMKQCQENPWLTFSENNSLGDVVKGEVRSITDFGMFVGLDGNIDGLVHLSDLSWNLSEEEAVKSFAKGQELEAVILGIDPHKERISLGIKQLSEDVFDTFAKNNPKGSKLTGPVSSIGEDQIFISLAENVIGKIKIKEFKDNFPSEGDSITSLVTSIDRKNRQVNLSVFALEKSQEKELIKENISKNKQIESETKTSIGDLIQEELSDSSKD